MSDTLYRHYIIMKPRKCSFFYPFSCWISSDKCINVQNCVTSADWCIMRWLSWVKRSGLGVTQGHWNRHIATIYENLSLSEHLLKCLCLCLKSLADKTIKIWFICVWNVMWGNDFSAVCLLEASKTMRAVQTVYNRVLRNAWTTTNTDQHVG